MAWISVHEQVIGAKLRNLAKEIGCSQNEALGILIRLWLWAINNAGKDGCIIGADNGDVAEVLTNGLDKRYDPDAVVDALAATGWIDIENGLYIHDWEEWQSAWYKALEIRQRDTERKRRERAEKRLAKKKGEPQKGMEQDLPTPHLTILPKKEQKEKPEKDYSKDFEEFWSVYPRKIGKAEAYKKYKARLNDGWSPAELLEAVGNYAAKVVRERTDPQYIKHAKTFLSENTPFADFIHGSLADSKSGNDDDSPYGEWRQ